MSTTGDNVSAETANSSCSTVSVKLPSFWVDNPVSWFQLAEAQFRIKGIKEETTKFYHVTANLPSEVSRRVRSLLQAPSSSSAYTDIKRQLLAKYTPTAYRLSESLVQLPGLGSQSPSELMDEMLSLVPAEDAAVTPNTALFRYLFLSRMPADIRAVLLKSEVKDMDALATVADEMWSSRPPSVSTVGATDPEEEEFVAAAAPAAGRRARQRPARSATDGGASPGVCYYHARFASRAQKCTRPCSFRPGN